MFCCTQNGVDRAGLNAFCTADTFVLANIGYRGTGVFFSMFVIQGNDFKV